MRDGEKVIELNSEFVYPGFIDSHCHMGLYEWGMDLKEQMEMK